MTGKRNRKTLRFNTINEDVEEVLEFIDKHSRKYFIETAVLYYLKHLKENKNIIDVCLDIDKFENRKTKTEKKSATKKATTKKIVSNFRASWESVRIPFKTKNFSKIQKNLPIQICLHLLFCTHF